MIFPLRTDRRLVHVPWINTFIIGLNILVFLFQMRGMMRGSYWWAGLQLHPIQPEWYQFFTYQFLHADWSHILANMLFLYVFGNSVEDRFGPIGYLLFYLAGGVVAALGHGLVSPHPMLGASGSVSAVTGAFVALFPNTRVLLLVFFYFTEIASVWLIGLFFLKDLIFQLTGAEGVAYLAHLSGNVYGFVIAMALLASRILAREPYDLIALIRHWNRRRQFRMMYREAAGAGQGGPWLAQAGQAMAAEPATQRDRQLLALRAEVTHHLAMHEPEQAVAAYRRLLDFDPEALLPGQSQLDLANIAMRGGEYDVAAQAYETYLRHFGDDDYASEVHLILGLIYGRYLDDPPRARRHLNVALERLSEPSRRTMAQQLLAELGMAGG